MNLRIPIAICSILLITCGVLAQENERELALSTQLEALIDAQFPSTRCPELSVAVASNDKVVFSKAFGLADLEQRIPSRALKETRVDAHSVQLKDERDHCGHGN